MAPAASEAPNSAPSAHPQCPMLPGFDPCDTDAQFGWMAKARETSPVFYMPEYDLWCVTRHEDALDVLRDIATFSSRDMIRVWPPPGDLADDLKEGHPLEGTLVTTDPPAHTRIRKLAQKATTPRQVKAQAPAIRGVCDELIDRLDGQRSADLMGEYAELIVTWSIASVIGCTREDAVRFRAWTNDAHVLAYSGPNLDPVIIREYSAKMVDFDRWIRELIDNKRNNPGDDITTALINAKSDDGEQSLSDREIVAMIAGFVAAGSDTTATIIGHAVYLLLKNDQWDQIVEDRSLIPAAVEETLRFRNSVTGMRRTATCDTVINGVDIPEGSQILIHIVSANRDEEVFKDADTFNIHREALSEHLSLGKWRHFCLGAPLARLEAKIALERLSERIPQLRLSEGADLSEYVRNLVVPSLLSLDVAWEGRPSRA